jgi:hypothetical protein
VWGDGISMMKASSFTEDVIQTVYMHRSRMYDKEDDPVKEAKNKE